jgi:hypothetical protein
MGGGEFNISWVGYLVVNFLFFNVLFQSLL